MRAIWKGAISFGLVTIPVSLYSATEEKDIRFHQVHREDGGRIKYKRVCSIDGEEVPYDDIAKGYELGGGEMVILTDDDFEDLPLTTSRAIEVLQFVPAEQVDPILLRQAYYLEPDKTAAKPYVLLRDALDRTGAGRAREGGAAAAGAARDAAGPRGVLVLNTMLWPDEIRERGLRLPRRGRLGPPGGADDGRLADRVDGGRLRPGEYTDNYREALQEVIDAKVAGREVCSRRSPRRRRPRRST